MRDGSGKDPRLLTGTSGMPDRRRADRRRPAADALVAADNQRRQFARQLHDDTIQTLLSIIQDLEQAKLAVADPVRAAGVMQHSIELLSASVGRLRERASDDDPNAPIGVALADGVQLLADQAARRGSFACKVQVAPGPVGGNERLILAIVRELLLNVTKHAQASEAAVEIGPAAESGIRIVVTDNGIGVTSMVVERAFADGHIGLPLIAARVEERDGWFTIDGRTGHGTQATVFLPACTD